MRRWRYRIILGSLTLLYLALGWHMYGLQVRQTNKAAHAGSESSAAKVAERGEIFATDISGNRIPIALSKEFPEIFAVPEEVVSEGDPEKIAATLAPIVQRDLESLV